MAAPALQPNAPAPPLLPHSLSALPQRIAWHVENSPHVGAGTGGGDHEGGGGEGGRHCVRGCVVCCGWRRGRRSEGVGRKQKKTGGRAVARKGSNLYPSHSLNTATTASVASHTPDICAAIATHSRTRALLLHHCTQVSHNGRGCNSAKTKRRDKTLAPPWAPASPDLFVRALPARGGMYAPRTSTWVVVVCVGRPAHAESGLALAVASKGRKKQGRIAATAPPPDLSLCFFFTTPSRAGDARPRLPGTGPR